MENIDQLLKIMTPSHLLILEMDPTINKFTKGADELTALYINNQFNLSYYNEIESLSEATISKMIYYISEANNADFVLQYHSSLINEYLSKIDLFEKKLLDDNLKILKGYQSFADFMSESERYNEVENQKFQYVGAISYKDINDSMREKIKEYIEFNKEIINKLIDKLDELAVLLNQPLNFQKVGTNLRIEELALLVRILSELPIFEHKFNSKKLNKSNLAKAIISIFKIDKKDNLSHENFKNLMYSPTEKALDFWDQKGQHIQSILNSIKISEKNKLAQ